MINFLFLAAGFLLGSIPFGLFTGRIVKGIDIREHGSKNIGATNVFRVVGKKWGLLVFILDALKGYFAVLWPAGFMNQTFALPQLLALAVAAILGHSFPVWLSFRGGKGVATSLGVFLAVAPKPTLLTFAFWGLVFLTTRILSLASIAAAIVFPGVVALAYKKHVGFEWLFSVSLLLTLLILFTHRSNIRRLLKGEEKRLF